MTFNHNPKHNTNLLQKTGRNFGLVTLGRAGYNAVLSLSCSNGLLQFAN